MLTEGVATSILYKFYQSGQMAANAEPDLAAEPGPGGWTPVRRVSSTLDLMKEATQSAEILPSRQVRTFRHSGRRAEGNIAGELSPGSYFDFFEAIHRDTRRAAAAVPPLTQATHATLAADAAAGTLTFGGGDPVAAGLRVGDVVSATGLSEPLNEGARFIVLGFSGASNRTVEVAPAPATMPADATFSLALVGASTEVPRSGHLRRKLAVEIFREDLDRSRLFTEMRLNSYRVTTGATGIVGVEFGLMGRNMHRRGPGLAPYHDPATVGALSETQGCDAVNGVVRARGRRMGVVTGLNFGLALAADAPRVQQKFPPDILLGTARGTGELSVLVDDSDLAEVFDREEEFEVTSWLTSGEERDAHSVAFHMPRCKATGAREAVAGEGSQALTIPIQLLEYLGDAPGVPRTTIKMFDTAATAAAGP